MGRDTGTGVKVPIVLRTFATTLLALAATAAPAAAHADLALLERHAPTLHYTRDEADRATAVEALTPRVADEEIALRPRVDPLPDVAYGRAVADRRGRTWLQYWLLYADNPQDRGIVRTGRHEGDWELVQVGLDERGRAVRATYAQHSWAEACERYTGDVYVAHGSHASYPERGDHDRPFPDPTDEARGDGRSVTPEIRQLGRWVVWPGRWGRADAGIVPGENSSPRGPAFQPAWDDPAAYHREARTCGSGAPPLHWTIYVGAGLLLSGFIGMIGYITLKVRRRLSITGTAVRIFPRRGA
jgi:hypothetical protein